MTQKTYGRRFPNLDSKKCETTYNIIESTNSLIYRTLLDRPANEDAIRGLV